MIQDRNGRCSSRTNQWRANRDAHMANRLFCSFGLEYLTPDLLTLSIECKCRTMVGWSQFITFANSRVYWRESLWIDVLKRSSWTWSVSNVKMILLKTRKPFSCRALSNVIEPIHGGNVSGWPRCCFLCIELRENKLSEMVQFLHLELHFLASTVPLTILKLQNFNM